VNSAAIEDPGLLQVLAERFGRQCVVLALDAARTRSGWEVLARSGRVRTGLDALVWAQKAEQLGAGEILLTSWDRDGTGSGYDLELLSAICESVAVPVVASGGAAGAPDLSRAFQVGACGALVASILHKGQATVASLKAQLARDGVEVR
jgi:cyclase